MRVKIGAKLGILFLVFFFEILTFIFFLSVTIRQYRYYGQEVRKEYEEMEAVNNLRIVLAQAVMPVNDFLIAGGDPNEPENFIILSKKFERNLGRVAKLEFELPEEKKILIDMEKDWSQIKKIAQQIFSLPNPIGNPEAGRLMEEMDKVNDHAIVDSERFDQLSHEEIDAYAIKAKNAEGQIALLIRASVLFNIFLIITGLFFFRKNVVFPITSLRNAAIEIGKGNLKKITGIDSGDEVEDLAASFNQMVEELNKSRNELLSAKDYVDNIVTSMIDDLIVINQDGTIRTVNKATCDLSGYREEELIGKEVSLLFIEEERLFKGTGLEKLIKEGAMQNIEMTLLAKNGEKIPMSFSGSVMYATTDDGRRMRDELSIVYRPSSIVGVVGIARDMRRMLNLLKELKESKAEIEYYSESLQILVEKKTKELKEKVIDLEDTRRVMFSVLEDTDEARKGLEKAIGELRSTQAQLVQTGKLAGIGQMAAGVAHEINNPLTSIMGFAQLTMSRKDIDGTLRTDLLTIEKEAKRCVTIIENLLNFARPQESYNVKLHINNVVEATLKVVEYSITREKIGIVKKYAEALPAITGDPSQLQQVFMNIILNAVHAMPKGGMLTVETRMYTDKSTDVHGSESVRIRVQKSVEIRFTDTGIGIPDENRAKIFEPFFTTSYKTGYKGTGLGLSISHSIVQAHHGRIEVESEVGKGSTFRVILPV